MSAQDPISRDEVEADLQRVAIDLARAPTAREYDDYGTYSRPTVERTHGSYTNAVRCIGLEPQGNHHITKAALLVDLKQVADDLGRPPSNNEYENNGSHSASAFRNRWESWSGALEAADLDPDNAGLSHLEINRRRRKGGGA